MAIKPVVIAWTGSSDVNADSEYMVKNDRISTGDFVMVQSRSATPPYRSHSTTLAALIPDGQMTTVTLADGSNFETGQRIIVGNREAILLGTKNGAEFTDCERDVLGTIAEAHDPGTLVVAQHEVFQEELDFPVGRRAVRYHIELRNGDQYSIPSETIVYNPTPPPTNNLATLYGIATDIQSNPMVGTVVQLQIREVGDSHSLTKEMLHREIEETVTDADGYFEFFVPRSDFQTGDIRYDLVLAPDDPLGRRVEKVEYVPNKPFVNYQETR